MPLLNRPGPAQYVPEADVTETLPDGRTIQVAVAGHPMDYRDAVKAGLVGPSETKEAPARAPATPAPAPEPADDGTPPPPAAVKAKAKK